LGGSIAALFFPVVNVSTGVAAVPGGRINYVQSRQHDIENDIIESKEKPDLRWNICCKLYFQILLHLDLATFEHKIMPKQRKNEYKKTKKYK
jgi:hypothetical protein